jgi:hypothetical protein
MGLAMLGSVFLWCSYPIINLVSTLNLTSTDDAIISASQVNMWLALAASVLGCYTTSAFLYQKFRVREVVFTTLTVKI